VLYFKLQCHMSELNPPAKSLLGPQK